MPTGLRGRGGGGSTTIPPQLVKSVAGDHVDAAAATVASGVIPPNESRLTIIDGRQAYWPVGGAAWVITDDHPREVQHLGTFPSDAAAIATINPAPIPGDFAFIGPVGSEVEKEFNGTIWITQTPATAFHQTASTTTLAANLATFDEGVPIFEAATSRVYLKRPATQGGGVDRLDNPDGTQWGHRVAGGSPIITGGVDSPTAIKFHNDWVGGITFPTAGSFAGEQKRIWNATATPIAPLVGQQVFVEGVAITEIPAYSMLMMSSDGTDVDGVLVGGVSPVINPDDVAPWISGETGLSQGDLRKHTINGAPHIFGRIAAADADEGGTEPGVGWQDITDQSPDALNIIDSDADGPTFFGLYGLRYQVTGSTPITILIPTDGGANADLETWVYNAGSSTITIEGVEVPAGPNTAAKVVADPDVGGPQIVLVGASKAAKPWLPTTAATVAEDGDRLIVMPGSAVTLPAIPAAGDSVVVYLAPDSKWEGLTYTINTVGADTFPTVEVFGNSRVTAIGLPGETEWRVYEGADGAIESNIVVDTRADLPAANTLFSGRTGVILDENGAVATALGTAGQPAIGWSL